MNVKSRAKVGAAILGAAALGVGILAAPASADAPIRQLAGVGSDTTQYVMNGLANGSVVVNAGGANYVTSWDAVAQTGAADPFTTKNPATTPGCTFTRAEANGSSNGIKLLNADIANGGSVCLDFARSSRQPNDTSNADLTWIPFAKDAVTWATDLGSTIGSETPGNSNNPSLTTAQLKEIYTTCKYTWTDNATPPVVHTHTDVRPLLPQAGSGTRTYFLTSIGVTEAQVTAAKASTDCAGKYNDNIQEHDGTAITNLNQIMPYSVAQWIAQGKSLPGVPNRRDQSRLRNVGGVAPTTGSGSALALNPSFVFTRDVYNVVQTSRLNEAAIDEAFVVKSAVPGDTADVCQDTTTITTYGFATIPNCGATTLTGKS
ncbi:hypothetical protein ABZ883_05585 [Streptomyces sp. NPDC046977]|uniref:hypothetical protein n=1 Tax=Streptomyces sp. NPDC046977 TaxID=3154703 RepID=UPI003406ECB4